MRETLIPGISAEKHVAALVVVARDALSRWCGPTCCVSATLAGIDVLRGWGLKAMPLYTETIAANREWVAGARTAPAYSVMIGLAEPDREAGIVDNREGDGFNGHLVIYGKSGSQKFLIDLSAWQMDRPQRRVHVPIAVGIEVDKPCVGLWAAATTLSDGGLVTYRTHPLAHTREWETSPDWSLTSELHQRAHHGIVHDMREYAYAALTARS